MLVSDISSLTSTYQCNNKKNDSNVSFADLFKSVQSESTVNKSQAAVSGGEILKNDADFKPKFKKEILPSGQEYTSFNVEDNLTESDKIYLKSLGWPTATASAVNELANWIAFDRVDGSLTGPVTKDYLLGDKSKGIAGLVDRLQGEGQDFKKLCEEFLSNQGGGDDHMSLSSTLLETIAQSMKSA